MTTKKESLNSSHGISAVPIKKNIITSKIFAERIQLLYRHLFLSVPANFICATIVLIALLKVQPNAMWIWYGTMIIISAVRIALAKWLHALKSSLKLQLNLFIIGVGITAILWGALGSLLMPADLYQQMIVIIIIAGITAGGLQTLQPSPVASSIFAVGSIFPLCLWLFSHNHFTYIALGIAISVYLLFIISTSWRGYWLIVETLKLRYENIALLKNLSEINVRLVEANQSLQESQKRFKSAFDDSMIGMSLVSLEGKWLKVNTALCDIVKYSESELLKMNIAQITYPEDLNKNLKHLKQMLAGHSATYQIENRYIRKDNEIIWVLASTSLVRDTANTPLYFITQVQDIDAHKKAEEQLKNIALHDPLTGLSNRKQLEIEFNRVALFAERNQYHLAVFFIDLDNFKHVNDSLGHEIGDILLKIVAIRLQSCVRKTDIVARLGGDEFIIITTELHDDNNIINIANNLCNVIKESINIQNHKLNTTASIGISIYPKDGQDFTVLLKKADEALYQVKKAGCNNYKFFTE